MAEYYPLLAKAVASLPNSTPDSRRVIYERARKALLGQLRNLQPPVPDEDIARESDALDAAVTRLETEFAAAAPPVEAPATAPPSAPDLEPALAPTNGLAPAVASMIAERPSSTLLAPRARVPRPPPLIPPRPVPRPVAPEQIASPPAPVEPPPPPPPPRASDAVEATPAPPAIVATSAGRLADVPQPADAPALRVRAEPQRPFAPQPPRPAAPQRRTWIVAAVVAAIVVVVGGAAYTLRVKPEDLTRVKTATPVDPAASGKIGDRVGNPSASGAPQNAPAVAASTQQAQSAAPAAPPPLAVAHRAALLIEAPDEPNKVKTYLGTVLWKLDNVSNGPGQPLSTAVRADVDIPDDKLQASFVFQKNTDATLPASHTIKIQFTLGAGSPSGNVRQINVPQMRKEDTPSGEGLSGIPVPITENSFLVGLSRGTSEESNIDLLRTRAWLDLPMLMSNGRIAKMTLEKSTSGQRAFDDALASWQQPGQ